jgi:hypothetical protein
VSAAPRTGLWHRDAAGRSPEPARRGVVPAVAGRTLWLAAIWTGVGAAAVCATVAIVAVTISWLPSAGASGHTVSAIRAGLLTFLAALHGGVVVDGTSAQFLPLGLTVLVALVCWRAGSGLADAATELSEQDPARLVVAALLQAASFAAAALIAVPFAHLGSSSASWLGVAGAGLLLFGVSGGCAFARSGPAFERLSAAVPRSAYRAARAAGAALGVYAGVAALLVAGSLALHAGQIEEISRQLGGGWNGVPVLLLGVLAAPNAVIAAMAYLLGPGFAVGAGAPVHLTAGAHGVLPAFPLLGALPHGGANVVVWIAVAGTPLLAGLAAARVLWPGTGWRERCGDAALATAMFAAAVAVLAWQGGGGIGSGRLRVVGASAWQVGGYAVVVVGAGMMLALGATWARTRLGARNPEAAPAGTPAARLLTAATSESMRTLRALTRLPADERAEAEHDRKGPRKLAG